MKKIHSGVMGFVAAVVGGVAAALVCLGCDDGGSSDYVELGVNKWMKKNLNVVTEDSWCYDDNPKNCKRYGRLYTWDAAVKACRQIGWRLPNSGEWEALEYAVGGQSTRLKAKNGWIDDQGKSNNGTDNYGFSALPGGYRNPDGDYRYRDGGQWGYWWTASEYGDGIWWASSDCGDNCAYIYIGDWRGGVGGSGDSRRYGYSVRCVKD